MSPATARVDLDIPCQVKEVGSKRTQPAGFRWRVKGRPNSGLGSRMKVREGVESEEEVFSIQSPTLTLQETQSSVFSL